MTLKRTHIIMMIIIIIMIIMIIIISLAETILFTDNVSPHMRLRGGVEFIDRIPKSPSGKILRRLLRDRRPISKL